MAWGRIDDKMHSHKKTMRIPRARRCEAMGLWGLSLSWCLGNANDGAVPAGVIELFGASASLADALVEADLWTPSMDGWRFVDWPRIVERSRNIPAAVRLAVMQRDGFRCQFCGATEALSLDHIIRFRDGGPDTIENLRVLCMPCNLERG
ncbi:HNH endonuclease [Nocardia sp. CDC159]|uniref:HNH endonuclease n=1 Tax=Nocardia pulmonis TaxID=2951408 RepID=A0A9X2E9I7_9NOCA|nr:MULTISPECIES: HNH endonuclease signature motif containing protein [Nocardia]MCM6776254.1 HNH endonuclease [Nocardia pulmonis]MCM6788420.1 HNH endonuclease [Nocardia sp. CDC159]